MVPPTRSGSSPPRRGPGLLRQLLFALLAAVLASGLAEGGARLYEQGLPPAPLDLSSPLVFQKLPSGSPVQPTLELATLHGVDLRYGGYEPDGSPENHLTINPGWADLQGQHIVSPRPPDELRVVILGESAIGGWGMPRTATAVGIAERLLRVASTDKSIRLFNLGRTGMGSPQLSEIFSRLAPLIEPDLTVTVLGNNERLDVAASVHAVSDDEEQVLALTSPLALSLPLQDLNAELRWLVSRSAFARRLWLALRPEAELGHEDAPPDDQPPPEPEGGELMPPLSKLRWPEPVDSFALHRMGLTFERIADQARSAGGRLLISTLPVNYLYRHPEHEWHFFGTDLFRLELYRTAHWAYYFEAPEAGASAMAERLTQSPDELPAHLLLGHFLVQSGRGEEGERHLRRVAEKLKAKLASSLTESGASWQANDELLLAWSVRLLEGPEAAAEVVAPLLAEPHWHSTAPGASLVCHHVDLLVYSGDKTRLPEAARDCLRDAYYYRADPATNARLLQIAGELGALSFDLAADLAGYSWGPVPGYEFFLDYCHYNPRGNLLVGYLLAREIAKALKLPGAIPDPRAGLDAFQRQRAGLLHDLPGLDHWVGVNFDVTLLTAERYGTEAHTRREGDPSSALAKVFAANEIVSGRRACFGLCGCHCSASFGPRDLMFLEAGHWDEAAGLYREVMAREPELSAAEDNLALLPWMRSR